VLKNAIQTKQGKISKDRKFDEVPSMLQKFYVYLTKGLKIQKVSSLIKTLDIYQDYSNFLSHDINWDTFLFLFRLTSFKEIAKEKWCGRVVFKL
ncbi:hypothetical protein PFDG_04887, partial [Plasmodium falciparum Dd2]